MTAYDPNFMPATVVPAPQPAPPTSDRAGMATAALVLGILAIVFAFIPIIGLIAFILAPLAIIFGVLGRRSSKRGQAIAGLATGGAGLAISILWMALFTAAVGGAATELDRIEKELDAYSVCVDKAGSDLDKLAKC